MWERALWEQSLLAIQALRSSRDRGVFIAGKPCSHTARPHSLISVRQAIGYRIRTRNERPLILPSFRRCRACLAMPRSTAT
ncbi:hypothetical protein C1C98_29220 [Pseudomonas ogarae]|uniref:DUF1534 domain-containing protein n=1 Tax=Pseudomonas ogarae (strain DSM 112162 / CECT 30235 / F113) TaxID=1114970 RepID=A0ABN5GI28_PSEO1|nr:hypothetical protein C1C98_29220 [Pseudomonas ogarae]